MIKYGEMLKLLVIFILGSGRIVTGDDLVDPLEDLDKFSVSNVTRKLISPTQGVTLICNRRGESLSGADITWIYMPCEGLDCDSGRVDGQRLCDKTCPVKLRLEKPRPGMYKCYKTGSKVGYTLTAVLISAYHIEIFERSSEPEFIEEPEDTESFAGSSPEFFCQIRSSLPLRVKWYKRVDKAKGAIQYDNKFYLGLNGSETSKRDDLYSSRYQFKRVTRKDEGVYACCGVNEAGIQYREAKLIVQDIPGYSIPINGQWKIILILSAVGFLAFIFSCICCIEILRRSCRRSSRRVSYTVPDTRFTRPKPPPRPRPTVFTDNETSDYEHVIALSSNMI